MSKTKDKVKKADVKDLNGKEHKPFEIVPASEAAIYSARPTENIKQAVDQGIRAAANIGVHAVTFEIANRQVWEQLRRHLEEKGYWVKMTDTKALITWGGGIFAIAYHLIGPSPTLERVDDEI